MSNIAEGSKRATPRDYAHFLNIAEGSSAEIETLLITSGDQSFLAESDVNATVLMADEISRMLYALRKRVLSP